MSVIVAFRNRGLFRSVLTAVTFPCGLLALTLQVAQWLYPGWPSLLPHLISAIAVLMAAIQWFTSPSSRNSRHKD
jgi:hypothetical protein